MGKWRTVCSLLLLENCLRVNPLQASPASFLYIFFGGGGCDAPFFFRRIRLLSLFKGMEKKTHFSLPASPPPLRLCVPSLFPSAPLHVNVPGFLFSVGGAPPLSVHRSRRRGGLSPCHYALLTPYPPVTGSLFKVQPSIYLSSPSTPLPPPLLFFSLSPLIAFVEAPFNYLLFPLSSCRETASLRKYLRFMNMPSLSTQHRCGRSTDETLIAAHRGPLAHSSPFAGIWQRLRRGTDVWVEAG